MVIFHFMLVFKGDGGNLNMFEHLKAFVFLAEC